MYFTLITISNWTLYYVLCVKIIRSSIDTIIWAIITSELCPYKKHLKCKIDRNLKLFSVLNILKKKLLIRRAHLFSSIKIVSELLIGLINSSRDN